MPAKEEEEEEEEDEDEEEDEEDEGKERGGEMRRRGRRGSILACSLSRHSDTGVQPQPR